jgi:hypothetical protein
MERPNGGVDRSTAARSTAARSTAAALLACGIGLGLAACRPSDVLSVPPPAGVTSSSAYQNQAGAEALLANGRGLVFSGIAGGSSTGVLPWSGLLGDEFQWAYFSFGATDANIDARVTAGLHGYAESGDRPLETLLRARMTLLSAVEGLKQFEPASKRSTIGEAYALIGYVETFVAEDYCAGVPLDALAAGGGVLYGAPLTTDSLLAIAEVDFDSAGAYTGGDATISGLAAVGLARARLNRGHYVDAAAAVQGVPIAFVYNTELQPGGFTSGGPLTFNMYDDETQANGCGYVNVADHKGGNGLDFVSAQDPRLVLSTTVAQTCDVYYTGVPGGPWYYPVKFGNPSTYVPMATGIEAQLIKAEAALNTNQVTTWASDLRTLRGDTADTHMPFPAADSLPADSAEGASGAARIDLLFRERAFWLYGTGTRLGDLRRLIRQYARDQSTLFPTGPYPHAGDPGLPAPLPNYGTDVSLTLPTPAGGLDDPNPAYRGCLTSTTTA